MTSRLDRASAVKVIFTLCVHNCVIHSFIHSSRVDAETRRAFVTTRD